MPQSYTSCHYHVTFATKDRKPFIDPELQKRLYPYIGGILRESDGEMLTIGTILVRQNGTPFQAGMYVGRGRDDTLFALREGKVIFKGRRVSIEPIAAATN